MTVDSSWIVSMRIYVDRGSDVLFLPAAVDVNTLKNQHFEQHVRPKLNKDLDVVDRLRVIPGHLLVTTAALSENFPSSVSRRIGKVEDRWQNDPD